jgi:uncharacterized protein involved in exopolysaccharide biosynthesis
MAALKASVPAKESAVRAYRQAALDLDKKELLRQDLLRLAKAAEENYLLYLRKQEEARIAHELDRMRILNVAITEPATVPLLPTPSYLPLKLAFAVMLAAMLSIGLAFTVDHHDRTLRTPAHIQASLGVPVLASIPLVGNAAQPKGGR